MKRFLQLAALLVTPCAIAAAQKTVIGMSGTIMRYHGDTIWMERDSTARRSVTHGDTIEQTFSVNGVPGRTVRYVLRGDSAWAVRESRDGLPPVAGARVPRATATMLNQMLEMEVRGAQTQASLEALPMFSDRDSLAGQSRSYTVAPDVHMTRNRDTVLYIRGCPDQHPDTTVFQLFGADSVKRLSTPQRMFGQSMAVSLTSKMKMAALQEFASRMAPALPADLPKAPGGCSK